jgi:Cytochrome P450
MVWMRWEQFTQRANLWVLIANRSGSMIEAGSETTSQILNNTIVGLLSNPKIIQMCHEELDRVVGDSRTPTIDDVHELHWIRSLVKVEDYIQHLCRKPCDGDRSTNLESITMSQKTIGTKDISYRKERSL